MEECFDFDDLIGKEFDFYGVDSNCFKLDDVIYEAIEDEDDGWRSMLGCVEARDAGNKIFFGLPVARVVIEEINGCVEGLFADNVPFRGYKLVDLHDGHEWLRFGTEDYNDYYPMFIFDYSPKGPAEQ